MVIRKAKKKANSQHCCRDVNVLRFRMTKEERKKTLFENERTRKVICC